MTSTLKLLLLALAAFGLTSCLTQRTVREGGHVEKKYVIKRPLKNVLENVEVE